MASADCQNDGLFLGSCPYIHCHLTRHFTGPCNVLHGHDQSSPQGISVQRKDVFHDTQLSAGFLCCYYDFGILISPKFILKGIPQHSGAKKWGAAMHPGLEHVCNLHKAVALIPSTIKHKSEPLGGWNSANLSDLSDFPFYFCPTGDDKGIILGTKSDPW